MNFWEYLYVLGIPPAIVALIFFVLRKFLGGKIDFNFNKKLAEFNNQLQISTESARFDFQRKIQDFNLYTVKKHEKYIKLYELVLEVKYTIDNFHFGSEEIENKLQKIKVSFSNYKNYYEASKLYLTNSIDNKLNDLRITLALLITEYEKANNFPFENNRNLGSGAIDASSLLKTFEVQISEITLLLKEELSIGYYKEN